MLFDVGEGGAIWKGLCACRVALVFSFSTARALSAFLADGERDASDRPTGAHYCDIVPPHKCNSHVQLVRPLVRLPPGAGSPRPKRCCKVAWMCGSCAGGDRWLYSLHYHTYSVSLRFAEEQAVVCDRCVVHSRCRSRNKRLHHSTMSSYAPGAKCAWGALASHDFAKATSCEY